MSKKKGKPVARKAPIKQMVKRSAPKKSALSSRSAAPSGAGAEAAGRTLTVTVFLFRTGNGNKIRTSPQRIYANPGDRIAWNVVNLIDGTDVPVTLTWPEAGPWGKDPIQIRSWDKKPVADTPGRFKYVVSALDAQEDPEVEIPEGN
jgi:hypothetical protein